MCKEGPCAPLNFCPFFAISNKRKKGGIKMNKRRYKKCIRDLKKVAIRRKSLTDRRIEAYLRKEGFSEGEIKCFRYKKTVEREDEYGYERYWFDEYGRLCGDKMEKQRGAMWTETRIIKEW